MAERSSALDSSSGVVRTWVRIIIIIIRPKGDPGPLPIFQDLLLFVKSHPWDLLIF